MRKVFFLLLISLLVFVALFGCSAKSVLPAQYTNDNQYFKQAIISLNEARDLSNPPGSAHQSSFELPQQTEDKIFANTEQAIRLSKQISDEYFDYLHPQLRDMLRNKLIKGTEVWYDGVKDNNAGKIAEGAQKQIQGNQLIVEWLEWWERNGEGIADKVFAD